MGSATSILLTEEDPAMRAFLADNLTADGYDVHAVENRAAALAALETDTPGLVIADVNGDTLTLIDAVRGADGLASRIAPDTPLIVLTGRGDELARIRYLDRGSDDVLARPFSYPELRARVRALLRRAGAPTLGRVVRVGALTIDRPARDVRVAGRPVELSAKEYGLLVHLATEPTRVFTKSELQRDVWGFRAPCPSRTLESHAHRLRRKLVEASPSGEHWVDTVWGIGYRLVPIGVPDPIAA